MKNKLSQAIAASVLAAGLLFAAPAVAQAYTPTGPNTVSVTVTADGPVPISGFEPGASVTFTLVGEGVTGANLAAVKLAVTSASTTKTADSSGVASATVSGIPAGASWTLSATGARAGAEAGGGSSTLPSTGGDSDSLLGIWIGGGALVLAGATIAVGASVRRGRQQADA